MPRVIALTGTPGTGKSAVAERLASPDVVIIELSDLANRTGAVVGRDEERLSDEVDLDILDQGVAQAIADVPEGATIILVGHLAHCVQCDQVVVLRTSPGLLKERLRDRGWPEAKVAENVEAEAVGVIMVESKELEPPVPVWEIDTTSDNLGVTVERFNEAVSGSNPALEAGWVDWSEEVMGWF